MNRWALNILNPVDRSHFHWLAPRKVAAVIALSAIPLTFGCDSKAQASTAAQPASAEPVTVPITPYDAEDPSYKVTFDKSDPCAINRECTVVLRLVAKNQFHINKEFQHKFTGTGSASVDFKAPGSFGLTFIDERTGTVPITFTLKAPADPVGKFKFVVCTDQQCQPTTLALSIPALRK